MKITVYTMPDVESLKLIKLGFELNEVNITNIILKKVGMFINIFKS